VLTAQWDVRLVIQGVVTDALLDTTGLEAVALAALITASHALQAHTAQSARLDTSSLPMEPAQPVLQPVEDVKKAAALTVF